MIKLSKRAAWPFLSPRVWLALGAAVLLGAGCVGGPGRGIDSLHVFTAPVALELDGSPGADGFGLTLYASAAAKAKGVPITTGTMEILMFDGAIQGNVKTNPVPRRVWTYTAADLKKYAIQTSLGTGYRFTPLWGDTPPLQNRISIVARYLLSRDASIQSAPTTIAVTGK